MFNKKFAIIMSIIVAITTALIYDGVTYNREIVCDDGWESGLVRTAGISNRGQIYWRDENGRGFRMMGPNVSCEILRK